MRKTRKLLRPLLLCLGAALTLTLSAFANETGTTTGDALRFRAKPSTDAKIYSLLEKGTKLEILGEENGWYKVRCSDGTVGYVSADYVAVTWTECKGTVAGGTINVRKGPGTDYGKITSVRSGKSVEILGEENGWYKLSFDGTTGYIRGDFVMETSSETSAVGAAVAAAAWNYLGVPYVYGGASPSGFDCSGFTLYLFKQHDISLPHGATAQYKNCGEHVAKENLQPGDLVFFSDSSHAIGHCAVYVGDDTIIHARNSVKSVVTNKLSSSYYTSHYVGAKRIG